MNFQWHIVCKIQVRKKCANDCRSTIVTVQWKSHNMATDSVVVVSSHGVGLMLVYASGYSWSFFFFYFRLSNRSVVDNGQSLNGTSLWELRQNETHREHSVRCILNIENWTSWRLKDPLAHNHCGYIHQKFPAPRVEPATREIMVGHKQVCIPILEFIIRQYHLHKIYIPNPGQYFWQDST